MTPIPLSNYLIVGAILFVLGAVGFLARRNMIIMFLSVEMMLQGVLVNLVAFGRYRGHLGGQSFALFIIAVAACEAAIALALFVVLYRSRHSLDVTLWQDLREPGQPPTLDEEPVEEPEEMVEQELPRLPVAGKEPTLQ